MSSAKKQKIGGSDWEQNRKSCLQTLKTLMRSPAATPFLLPVDWKALKLPTYPKIVKNPMDLGAAKPLAIICIMQHQCL